MSKKKAPNLSDIVNNESKKTINLNDPLEAIQENIANISNSLTEEPKQANINKPNKNNGRISTTIYVEEKVKKQLEELWFAERKKSSKTKSQNDLIMEAINLLFKDRGLPLIEELQ